MHFTYLVIRCQEFKWFKHAALMQFMRHHLAAVISSVSLHLALSSKHGIDFIPWFVKNVK